MSSIATQLCALIVDHFLGETSSRVLEALFLIGRPSFPALLYRTLLAPVQLKHSLAVLIQENLALWYTSEDGSTWYEANQQNCYNLIRSGKYLNVVEDRFQEPALSVVSHLITNGHTSVDLLFQNVKRKPKLAVAKQPLRNGFKTKEAEGRLVHADMSEDSMQDTLCTLLDTQLVQLVHESNFRPTADNRLEAEKLGPPRDGLSIKMKARDALQYEEDILKRFQDWKHGTAQLEELSDLMVSRKRKFEHLPEQPNKHPRLQQESKLTNGNGLRVDVNLRINHDKFSVIDRNKHFVQMAEICIGPTTSRIYAASLSILEKSQLECKKPTVETEDALAIEGPPLPRSLPQFSTDDLKLYTTTYDPGLADMIRHESAELVNSLGFVSDTQIHSALNDHPKKRRRKLSTLGTDDDDDVKVEGSASPDEELPSEVDSDGNISVVDSDPDEKIASDLYQPENSTPNPRNSHRSESALPPKPSPKPLTQHLLLLSKHPFKFLHHLPATSMTSESWSVDFRSLSKELLRHSLIQTVTARLGQLAARLVRILHEKGKLDEKTLMTLALLNHKTLRTLLVKLSQAGFIEVQEVPKDSQRAPSKTMYLWFFDEERCRKRLLNDTYKAMCRILQRIGVEKAKVKETVDKSERLDVQGHEDDFLGKDEKRALAGWMVTEEKLLGELGRLDDLVAILRDF